MQPQPTDNLKPYFLTYQDLSGPIDWIEFFGNENRVEIDVGCGRGMFLVNVGLAHPETNYLGIEIDYREGRHAARRLKKRAMPNVRVLGGDISIVFDTYLPPDSVSAVHVYFPDPWWKRKHRRRRVFTDRLVEQMLRIMITGGHVHVWSDVGEYFGVICALMDHHPRFEKLTPTAEHAPEHDLDYQTSYERKKRQSGETIFRGLWRLKEEA